VRAGAGLMWRDSSPGEAAYLGFSQIEVRPVLLREGRKRKSPFAQSERA